MRKYVILCKGIEDLTGAPRYVNNKFNYLKNKGWEVIVFWSFNINPVPLKDLKKFDDKRFVLHELLFFPLWFTKRQQDRVLSKMIRQIGKADQIVVESNKLQLGAWGEMLAQRLNAKHINFVTTEKIKIYNKSTFDYCYAKLQRHEFFTINPGAVNYLFSNFITFDKPEQFFWSASQGVEVKERDFPVFDEMGMADYTITSFGRVKGYFPYMLEELRAFISCHKDKKINVFFLGDIKNSEEIKEKLSSANVQLVIYPKAVEVVPRQVFTKSDIVIATAGCAGLAYRNGGRVITMDVNRKFPLGYLGYTTLDRNTDSGKYVNNSSLSEWLERLLINKETFAPLEEKGISHGFDYQMQFVNEPDGLYLDTSKVYERITSHDKMAAFITKIGLFCLVVCVFFDRSKLYRRWRRIIRH